MKNLILLFISLILFSSCCSANKHKAKTLQTLVKKTRTIEGNATVSYGKLIGTTQPIKTMAQTPFTPEVEVPFVKTIVAPVVTSTTPDVVTIIEHKTIIENPILDHTELHKPLNTLLKKNVSNRGNVNYVELKINRKILLGYINKLSENLPDENWTKNEKLSYWINAYNAMTIDLIVRNQPITSIKDIKNPWDQRLWKLGNKWYNLDEIEHKILRKMGDPRIHFGINCASFSCPPLLNEAFVPAKVNAQLENVATKFINDTSRNIISENSLEISKIFNWFAKDFKQDGSLIDFLNKYAAIKISEDAKVRYMDYNWALNK